MLGMLRQIELSDIFIDILNSYLLPREGIVAVEGALSEAMLLCDMVFQGTVLGPALWNTFFSDVATEIPLGTQEVNLYADDLNGVCIRHVDHSEYILMDELQGMQERAHAWGMKNRVSFDPGKENFVLLHSLVYTGDSCKLLGTLVDPSLSMRPCIESILSKARPKIRNLLRLKDMYSIIEMLNLYKTHIWSFTEYHSGAIIIVQSS